DGLDGLPGPDLALHPPRGQPLDGGEVEVQLGGAALVRPGRREHLATADLLQLRGDVEVRPARGYRNGPVDLDRDIRVRVAPADVHDRAGDVPGRGGVVLVPPVVRRRGRGEQQRERAGQGGGQDEGRQRASHGARAWPADGARAALFTGVVATDPI